MRINYFADFTTPINDFKLQTIDCLKNYNLLIQRPLVLHNCQTSYTELIKSRTITEFFKMYCVY